MCVAHNNAEHQAVDNNKPKPQPDVKPVPKPANVQPVRPKPQPDVKPAPLPVKPPVNNKPKPKPQPKPKPEPPAKK